MANVPHPGCLTSLEIAELAVDLLTPEQAQPLLAHAADCSLCAQALRQAIDDLERDLSPAEAQSVAQLLHHRPPPPRSFAPPPAQRVSRWLLAAAAVVVLSAGAWFFAARPDPVPTLLAQATATGRPFEWRLPHADYGRLEEQRSEGRNPPTALYAAQAALARRAQAGERTPEFLCLQAWSELLEHQVGTAVRTLEEARRLAPNNLDVASLLGAAYAARAEAGSEAGFDPAIEQFSRVLAQRPQDPAALFNRGLAYSHRKQYALAMADWRNLLLAEPSGPWSAEVRGLYLDADTKQKK